MTTPPLSPDDDAARRVVHQAGAWHASASSEGPPTAAPGGGPAASPRLRGADVVEVVVVSLGLAVGSAIAGVVIGVLLGGRSYAAVGLVTGAVGMWAGLWVTLVYRRGWGAQEMGFVRPAGRVRHLLWQVPAAIAGCLLGAALVGTAAGLTPGARSGAGGLDEFALGPAGAIVLALCAVLVGPAAEEVIFRRVLLDWLATRVRSVLAVPAAAAGFATVHVVPPVVVYALFLGVFAGILRVRYASLWPPLALHAANNALVVAVTVSAVGA